MPEVPCQFLLWVCLRVVSNSFFQSSSCRTMCHIISQITGAKHGVRYDIECTTSRTSLISSLCVCLVSNFCFQSSHSSCGPMYHTVDTVCQGSGHIATLAINNAELWLPPSSLCLWFPTFILPIHLADLAVTVAQVTLHDQTWSLDVGIQSHWSAILWNRMQTSLFQ